jgi:hypothetical protein
MMTRVRKLKLNTVAPGGACQCDSALIMMVHLPKPELELAPTCFANDVASLLCAACIFGLQVRVPTEEGEKQGTHATQLL